MDNRPSESLRSVATQLAELIATGINDPVQIKACLDQLNYTVETSAVRNDQSIVSPEDPGAYIGIWHRVVKNGVTHYERDMLRKDEWPLWANVHKFTINNNRKRVVLLGESVARGYFYDPFYSVASELQGVLSANSITRNYEVIDLAKTSIYIDELQYHVAASVELKPEAVIIFGGNNWISKLAASLTDEDYGIMKELFNKELFGAVKAFVEEKFRTIILSFLKAVKSGVVDKGIPVIFLVPAFNLRDWESDEVERILPWLPGERINNWLHAREIAEAAIAVNDMTNLETAARQMVANDDSNPLGYEFLAKAFLARGKYLDAIKCLEHARDTVLLTRGNNSKPRCYGVIRETILAEAGNYGIHAIDGQSLLIHSSANPVPGRELFLDYCHLTIDGIKMLAKHTIHRVIELAAGKPVSLDTVSSSTIDPGNEIKAMAHFCAAIHNAHYGQQQEILRYHCQKALSFSTGVRDAMLQFVDFSTRRASTIVCKKFEDIILNGSMRQYEGGLALPHPRNRKLMDIALIDAIAAALKKTGIHIEGELDALRKKEHAVGSEPVNLLESYYSLTGYNDFVVQPSPDFLQARNTRTIFHFVSENARPLDFNLEYRTPGRDYRTKNIRVFINDREEPIVLMPIGKKWVSTSFTIQPQLLLNGVNRIIIQWPYTAEQLQVENNGTANTVLNAMFPVLGEIYSFTAALSKENSHPGELQVHDHLEETN